MKALRLTAFGLVIGLFLLAVAPAVLAGDDVTPGRAAVIGGPDVLIAGWMTRLAEWLGWGTEEPQGAERPRAVVEAAKGDCPKGSGSSCTPPPATFTDCTGSVDPNGTPCQQ